MIIIVRHVIGVEPDLMSQIAVDGEFVTDRVRRIGVRNVFVKI